MLKKTGKFLLTVGTGALIGGFLAIIFGITCLVISNKGEDMKVKNVYDDDVVVEMHNGELVTADGGAPLMYCPICGGIMNGHYQCQFGEDKGCEKCIDRIIEEYKTKNLT